MPTLAAIKIPEGFHGNSVRLLQEGNNNLDDFLNKTENATFAFFTLKVKEIRGIYMMAILNDIVDSRLRLV